jgi:hypothetical protein
MRESTLSKLSKRMSHPPWAIEIALKVKPGPLTKPVTNRLNCVPSGPNFGITPFPDQPELYAFKLDASRSIARQSFFLQRYKFVSTAQDDHTSESSRKRVVFCLLLIMRTSAGRK